MINLDEILEKNKVYVAKHPELADKGLTSHPTKETSYCYMYGYALGRNA